MEISYFFFIYSNFNSKWKYGSIFRPPGSEISSVRLFFIRFSFVEYILTSIFADFDGRDTYAVGCMLGNIDGTTVGFWREVQSLGAQRGNCCSVIGLYCKQQI